MFFSSETLITALRTDQFPGPQQHQQQLFMLKMLFSPLLQRVSIFMPNSNS